MEKKNWIIKKHVFLTVFVTGLMIATGPLSILLGTVNAAPGNNGPDQSNLGAGKSNYVESGHDYSGDANIMVVPPQGTLKTSWEFTLGDVYTMVTGNGGYHIYLTPTTYTGLVIASVGESMTFDVTYSINAPCAWDWTEGSATVYQNGVSLGTQGRNTKDRLSGTWKWTVNCACGDVISFSLYGRVTDWWLLGSLDKHDSESGSLTLSSYPGVTTNAVSGVSDTTATLNGKLDSLGCCSTCDVWFQYGPTTEYGTDTTHHTLTATGSFNQPLTGLMTCMPYHFRAIANNGVTTYGDDITFSTNCPPTPTIIFYTDPSSSGYSITYDGKSYTNGQTTPAVTGSHNIVANLPSGGNPFNKWISSGCVTVTSPSSQSTTATVSSGSGTLEAIFGSYNPPPPPPNIPPTAFIDKIDPKTNVVRGQPIKFQGHGSDPDGSVLAYQWYSDIDKLLSNEGSFSSATLSGGTHHITFTVYDDKGAASKPVTDTVSVIDMDPKVKTDDATDVTNSQATLNGEITYASQNCPVEFYYRIKGAAIWNDISAGSGQVASYSKGITGLTSRTEYEFKFVATNSYGLKIPGNTKYFMTPGNKYAVIVAGSPYTCDKTGYLPGTSESIYESFCEIQVELTSLLINTYHYPGTNIYLLNTKNTDTEGWANTLKNIKLEGGKTVDLNPFDYTISIQDTTKDNFKKVLGTFAPLKKGDMLFILYMSHGIQDNGNSYLTCNFEPSLDYTTDNELSSTDFKDDLAQLGNDGQIVVAICACYSGCFIHDLSQDHRIIMTAAECDQIAMVGWGNQFIDLLYENGRHTYEEAFKYAADWIYNQPDENNKLHTMDSLLDDNNDGVGYNSQTYGSYYYGYDYPHQDGYWSHGVYVDGTILNVIDPNGITNKMNVEVQVFNLDGKFISGLTNKSQFKVTIDGKNATVLNIVENRQLHKYTLEVYQPDLNPAQSPFDVNVTYINSANSDFRQNSATINSDGSQLSSANGVVHHQETDYKSIHVDSTINHVKFLLTWPGGDWHGIDWSGSKLNLTLIDPMGTGIDPIVVAHNPNMKYNASSDSQYYIIDNPASGNWTVQVQGTNCLNIGDEYTIQVFGTTNDNISLGLYLDRDAYLTGQEVKISTSIYEVATPIIGATVTTEVEGPGGNHQLMLYDDGLHNDGQKNDGLYANIFSNTDVEGLYNFTVTVSGTKIHGGTFSRIAQKSVFITKSTEPNIAPVANADGPYRQLENETIFFDGSNSYDPDGRIISYNWDFGDGSTDTSINPAHTYKLWGTYTVVLTVTDNDGARNTTKTTASILAYPIANAGVPYNGYVGQEIIFDGSKSFDPDGILVQYSWDFGDGKGAVNLTPTVKHVYNNEGIYNVTLIVTDASGLTNRTTTAATIIVPGITLLYPRGGETLKDIVTVKWVISDAFGDSKNLPIYLYYSTDNGKIWSSFATNPLQNTGTYNWDSTTLPDGNYELQIVTYNSFGDVAHDSSQPFLIQNHEAPSGNHEPVKPNTPSGQTNGKTRQQYAYTTRTTDPDGDQVFYLWDWGDGNNSGWIGPYNSGVTISKDHTWSTKGSYSIKVKAKDIYGKESSWSDPLPITMPYSFNRPIVQFLELLFQRFPHAFPILRHLLGY